MKYKVHPFLIALPIAGLAVAAVVSRDFAVSIAVFAALLLPALVRIYIPYAKDNPRHLWFKRKIFGWGWTPVTWQGWLATLAYVALVVAAALTIDADSPPREIAFTFILPVAILTFAFVRLCYKKGERPRWQWGEGTKGGQDESR